MLVDPRLCREINEACLCSIAHRNLRTHALCSPHQTPGTPRATAPSLRQGAGAANAAMGHKCLKYGTTFQRVSAVAPEFHRLVGRCELLRRCPGLQGFPCRLELGLGRIEVFG